MLWESHGEVSGFQTIATCRDGLKKSRDTLLPGRAATNHALARYDVIIYVFRLRSLGRTVWRKPM